MLTKVKKLRILIDLVRFLGGIYVRYIREAKVVSLRHGQGINPAYVRNYSQFLQFTLAENE